MDYAPDRLREGVGAEQNNGSNTRKEETIVRYRQINVGVIKVIGLDPEEKGAGERVLGNLFKVFHRAVQYG